jgi:probable rRNA maturation factor
MPEVIITDMQEKVVIERDIADLLSDIISFTLVQEGASQQVEVSVALVDNDYIRELNKNYRCIDAPTDVLSFAMTEGSDGEELFEMAIPEGEILGDIVISMERAQEQARDYGHSLVREMGYLAVHGVLHLLGYDHELEEDKRVMRAKEEDILKAFDLKRE